MVSIGDMPTIKYWQNLEIIMDLKKENIPKQCIIGDTCSCNWKLLEVIHLQDIRIFLIMYTKTVMILCQ